MSYKGKIQLTFVISAPADLVAEGDRIFASHEKWMASSHHKDGPKALLKYNVSKAQELSNPMDPSSAKTGNTIFILNEFYASEAGVADHFEQAQSGWGDFPALAEWLGKCKMTGAPVAQVINDLW